MRYVSKSFHALCLSLVALCASLLVGAVAARAQIASDVTVEADIPHAFVVRDTRLPAGKYTIRAADDNDLNVLELRSADGRTAVFFDTESAQPREVPGKTELVFDKVGDTYFLSQVLVEGDARGSQVVKSRMEKRLEGKGLSAERRSVAAHMKSAKKSAKKSS